MSPWAREEMTLHSKVFETVCKHHLFSGDCDHTVLTASYILFLF